MEKVTDLVTSQQMAEDVLKSSPFAETEVLVNKSHRLLTRFGANRITQNVDQEKTSLGIRVIERKGNLLRTARIEIDSAEPVEVKKSYARLRKILDQVPLRPDSEDPVRLVERGQQYQNVLQSDDPFKDDLAHKAADAVGQACAAAHKLGAQASGSYSVDYQETAFSNSLGLSAQQRASDCEFAVSTDKGQGAGRGFSNTLLTGDLNVAGAIERSLKLCLDSQNPVAVPAGDYDVILEPAAFAELLVHLGWIGFSGKAYWEKRTFCHGKMGEKIFDDRITLCDLPLDPRVSGNNFDGEGIAKKNLSFVDHGVLRHLACDTRTAARLGVASTGHGMPQPNMNDPVPWNFSFQWHGHTAAVDEMISGVKRGIYVTQFHYTNTVDVMATTLTGMTRNGTFLIENGRITKAIKNLRFTQVMTDFLDRIELVSPDVNRVSAFFGGSSLCPAVFAKDFRFSSATDF